MREKLKTMTAELGYALVGENAIDRFSGKRKDFCKKCSLLLIWF